MSRTYERVTSKDHPVDFTEGSVFVTLDPMEKANKHLYFKALAASAMLALMLLNPKVSHAEPPSVKRVSGVITAFFHVYDPKSWIACRKQIPTFSELPLQNLNKTIENSGEALSSALQGQITIYGNTRKKALDVLKEDFQDALEADLRSACQARTSRGAFAVLRKLTTTNYSDAFLATWMEHSVLPIYGANAKKKTTPAAHGQRIARATKTAGLLDVQSVTALQDTGGPGSHNGVFDTGEWGQILVKLHNPSNKPHFSSSAFVASSGCIYVPTAGFENVLDEMSVDGQAQLQFWAYLGPCRGSNIPSLALTVEDTQRGKSKFSIRFPDGKQKPPPQLAAERIDMDTPGYSVPQSETHLRPGTRFELTHEVKVGGSVKSVSLSYGVPRDATSIFVRGDHTHRTPTMHRVSGPRFAPNDDWDKSIEPTESSYARKVLALRGSKRWLESEKPSPLWLAADIEVVRPLARAATSPASTPTTENTAAPLSAAAVSNLLRGNLQFRSRPATPSSDSVAAVAGHDVLLDFEAFEAAYNVASGLARVAEAQTHHADNTARYVYRYYVPLLIDVPGSKPKPRPKPKPRAKRLKPRVAKVVPKEPEPRPWARIDLGASGGLLFIEENNYWLSFTPWLGTELAGESSFMLPEGYIRATLGKTWAGFFGFRGGMSTIEGSSSTSEVTHLRWDLSVGLAYVAMLGESFELQPRAGISLRGREIASSTEQPPYFSEIGVSASDLGVAGVLGLTLRLALSETFLLHFDVAGQFGASGPDEYLGFSVLSEEFEYLGESAAAAEQEPSEIGGPLLGGTDLHFGGGLSIRF